MLHDHPAGQPSPADALVQEGPDRPQNRLPTGLLPQDGLEVENEDGIAKDSPLGPEALELREPFRDLDGFADRLPDEAGVKDNIDVLNQLHLTHYTRYPQDRRTPVPSASTIADSTVDRLIFTFTQSINPR